MPAGMTSWPMPSPASTAMRCVFIDGSDPTVSGKVASDGTRGIDSGICGGGGDETRDGRVHVGEHARWTEADDQKCEIAGEDGTESFSCPGTPQIQSADDRHQKAHAEQRVKDCQRTLNCFEQ